MIKNKKPNEQPVNKVERDIEATKFLAETLRKIGFNSKMPFAVYKVVAQKVAKNGIQEAVFTFPAHSEGQIKRFLMIQGWDVVAIVKYADYDTAIKDTNDANTLKAKGIVAKGNA